MSLIHLTKFCYKYNSVIYETSKWISGEMAGHLLGSEGSRDSNVFRTNKGPG